MNEPAIDEEEAQPRLLLTGPVRDDAVAAVLAALQPAALLVGGDSGRRWLEVARAHDVALLVEDDVDLALHADGLHLSEASRVSEARAALDRGQSDRLVLGADVGRSRHDAMVAGEQGVDYVAFGERNRSADETVTELVQWWRNLSILPCLAYAADAEAAADLARIGTDFIGVSSAIWDHPDGPGVAARDMSAAFEKSIGEKT